MRKPAFRAAFRVAFFSPMLSGISQLTIALAILVGGTQVLNNTGLSIGELISFTQYLNMVVMPLAMMAVVIPFLLRGDASARRIFEVYDSEAAIQDKADAKVLDPQKVKGKIAFDNVTFCFPPP